MRACVRACVTSPHWVYKEEFLSLSLSKVIFFFLVKSFFHCFKPTMTRPRESRRFARHMSRCTYTICSQWLVSLSCLNLHSRWVTPRRAYLTSWELLLLFLFQSCVVCYVKYERLWCRLRRRDEITTVCSNKSNCVIVRHRGLLSSLEFSRPPPPLDSYGGEEKVAVETIIWKSVSHHNTRKSQNSPFPPLSHPVLFIHETQLAYIYPTQREVK